MIQTVRMYRSVGMGKVERVRQVSPATVDSIKGYNITTLSRQTWGCGFSWATKHPPVSGDAIKRSILKCLDALSPSAFSSSYSTHESLLLLRMYTFLYRPSWRPSRLSCKRYINTTLRMGYNGACLDREPIHDGHQAYPRVQRQYKVASDNACIKKDYTSKR